MSVIFSRSCEYGLQAVMYIAMESKDRKVMIREIAEKVNIPMFFLGKILQKLSKSGVLHSQKGPNGGFALGDKAEKITALRIVEVIDGLKFNTSCVTGFPKCSNDTPCPFHDEWKIIRGKLVAMLEGETIQKLMEDAKSGKRVPFLNPEYFKEFKTSS